MARSGHGHAAALLILASPLIGCATARKLACLAPEAKRAVEIRSSPQTNGGVPTPVDLVYAGSKPAAQAIAKLTAADYYAQNSPDQSHGQLSKDFPGEVTIYPWELPAGYTRKDTVAVPCHVAAAFVFAGYSTGGPHRARLEKSKVIDIDLGPDDLTIGK